MIDSCLGFQCRDECMGPANHLWPQYVGSGVFKLCMEASRDPKVLCVLAQPLLEKLSMSAWEALDKANVWNPSKPVWVQAMIDLVDPYMAPVVEELLAKIEHSKKLDVEDVGGVFKEIVVLIQEMVPMIPMPVLLLTQMAKRMMPQNPKCKPICKSIITHVLICRFVCFCRVHSRGINESN